MIKYIFILFTFLSAFAVSTAAPVDSIPVLHNSIGISGSVITGFGVSYRYNIDNHFYVKTVGAVYFTEENTSESDLLSSIGVELQYNLIQTPSSRLYGFIGTSFWNFKNVYVDTHNGVKAAYAHGHTTTNLGIGCGFEIAIWGNFAANFDFGFQYAAETPHLDYESSSNPYTRIGMGGGIGFGYQF